MATSSAALSLQHPRLATSTIATIGIVALGLGIAVSLPLPGPNLVLVLLVAMAAFVAGTYVVSRRVEGRRRATDRLVTVTVSAAFAVALVPLVSLIWTTVTRGTGRFDLMLFTETMRNVVGEGGGIQHAIWGTLIITAIATVISVPLGVLVSVYLVEYGQGRLASAITLFVDVMTGIPSIVAGLFAVGLFTAIFDPGYRSGLAGAVALSVLMTPVVIRACEEMLRLVPMRLREAAYGLGVPKWRTILKIVLPTALPGMVTGVILAVARVIGETAPLLLAAGITNSTNFNPVEGRMASLPLFVFYSYLTPGVPPEPSYDRGWAAALVLMILVGVLFALARLLARVLTPKGMR